MPTDTDPLSAAADLVASAEALTEDDPTLITVFAAGERSFEAYRLNPTEGLASEFRSVALDHASRLGDAPRVRYRAGRKPDPHEIVVLPVGDVPPLEAIVSRLEGDATSLDLFDPESEAAKRARFYAVSVGPLDDRVHFVRATSPRARLRRRSRIAALLADGVHTALEQDPILFDDKVDFVVGEDVALVTNQGKFERALGFLGPAGAAAVKTLRQVTKNLAIENRDELLEAAKNDVNMIAKLRSVAEKTKSDPSYLRAMTTENVMAFVAEHPDLELETVEIDGERRLVFHRDPQRRWQILKVLDDDYLHSQITSFDYEANSKSVMT